MALLHSYTTQSGIVLPEAYLRVDANSVAVTHEAMTFAVLAYADAQARADGAPPVEAGRFYTAPYDMEAPNPFAQAYGWLKNGTPAKGAPPSEDYVAGHGQPGDPDYVAPQGEPPGDDYAPAVPGPYADAVDA